MREHVHGNDARKMKGHPGEFFGSWLAQAMHGMQWYSNGDTCDNDDDTYSRRLAKTASGWQETYTTRPMCLAALIDLITSE